MYILGPKHAAQCDNRDGGVKPRPPQLLLEVSGELDLRPLHGEVAGQRDGASLLEHAW